MFMVWPTVGSRTAVEQVNNELEHLLPLSLSSLSADGPVPASGPRACDPSGAGPALCCSE